MNMVPAGDQARGLPSYDISGLNILILEKQRLMRNLMKQVFREFNVSNLSMSANPHEAFELLCQVPPDIILSDWTYDLDGVEFLKQVRNDPLTPNPFVPVIVVTAQSELHHVVKARDAGMTEFLRKPVSARTIYSRICAVIDANRPFVRTGHFFGPDRRRKRGGGHQGPDRRVP